ncbi:hypothetical protein A0257_15335 [Hymenobacter psoromatis]|nr:hypothetical protein A0257_15335 [Hymenobacter psoromatis]
MAAKGLAKFKTGPLAKVKQASNFIEQNTKSSGALKGILGVAGSLGGVFGVAGSIAGLLWPSDDKPTTVTPAPTVSSGSISLKGTIETTTLIGSTSTEEPGTPHNFDGNTNGFRRASQPYYDCPMGLFNLRRTPQLAQRVYPRAKMYSGYRGQVPEELYTSYSVTQDLEPVFNQTSGMQVVSVKAAIVQKVGYSSLASIVDNPASPTRYNLLYAQVEAGNLEAVPFDASPTSSPNDDTYLVQTPFVDIGCFKDMAFTAPTDSLARSPAFIRIIATLRRTNASVTDAPCFFAQDYAFDALTQPSGNSSGGSGSTYLDINDYLPYNSGFTVLFNPADATFTGKVFQQYGQFFAAPNNLVFDYNSSLQMDVVRNGGTAGYGGGSGGFHAGNTISFEGELSIPAGMDVYMTTDPFLNRACSNPGLVAQAVGSCNPYNSWATTTVQAPPTTSVARKDSPAARLAVAIQLAPNPAMQSTVVSLVSTEVEPAGISRVEVLNLSGQVVWQAIAPGPTTLTMKIPLRGLTTGLYLVRVTTAGGSYAEKLVIQ